MAFLVRQWFLVALGITMLVGYFAGEQLEFLARSPALKWTIVSLTLFLMSWPVELSSFQQTLKKPKAAALGCLINMLVLPLMGWAIVPWLGPMFGPGLAVAVAAPATLASAAVWTRRAGGDDSVAILITIVTNGLCFLTMPFWIYWLTGTSVESSLLWSTVQNLFLFVVIPIGVAQWVRFLNKRLAAWATNQKKRLSVLAQVGILFMILLGAIGTRLKLVNEDTAFDGLQFGFMVAAVIVLHLTAFALGLWLAAKLGISTRQRIAVGIGGSQKTLMIGLTAAVSLGLSMIPIVVFQVFQLTVDAMIADWYRARHHEELGTKG